MTLVIREEHLPVRLSVPPMTDDEFVEFCALYPEYLVELSATSEAIIMPPHSSLLSVRGSIVVCALSHWAKADGRGVVTNGTGAFVLSNGARRSPYAAWTSRVRLSTQDPGDLYGFWHLCPEFVVELRSTHDRLPALRAKMKDWLDHGTELGWLIDPDRRRVEVYRRYAELETIGNTETIAAGPPVEGFELDLGPVWNPLQ